METNFPQGFYVERPSENAPDFVKCKISVKVETAIEWLQANKNERGYVNLDVLSARDTNKLYLKFNEYKKEEETIDPSSVPF